MPRGCGHIASGRYSESQCSTSTTFCAAEFQFRRKTRCETPRQRDNNGDTLLVCSLSLSNTVSPVLRTRVRWRRYAFSPDGRRVVTSSWMRTPRVFGTQTSVQPCPSVEACELCASTTVHPDGRRSSFVSLDKTVLLLGCGTAGRSPGGGGGGEARSATMQRWAMRFHIPMAQRVIASTDNTRAHFGNFSGFFPPPARGPREIGGSHFALGSARRRSAAPQDAISMYERNPRACRARHRNRSYSHLRAIGSRSSASDWARPIAHRFHDQTIESTTSEVEWHWFGFVLPES